MNRLWVVFSVVATIVAIMFAAMLWLELRYQLVLGAQEVTQGMPPWLVPVLITISTFLGVLARSVYEVLTAPNGAPNTYKGILAAALAPSKTILALVISPVLIGLFYNTIRSSDDVFFILVTSFQNGFFWKTLLKT